MQIGAWPWPSAEELCSGRIPASWLARGEGDEGKRRRMTSRTCGWSLRGLGWSRASYPRRPGLAGGGQQRLAVVRGCEEAIARFKVSRG